MSIKPFRKPKRLEFSRTYSASPALVWRAWTEPELLRRWWAPDKTVVKECAVDLRVDGEIYIVMEATAEMGKYGGTRWPMRGSFRTIVPTEQLVYDARSWTEGDEDGSSIEHTNTVVMSGAADRTEVRLTIDITRISPKAKMAAFGMKWGYKAYLDNLETVLASMAAGSEPTGEQ